MFSIVQASKTKLVKLLSLVVLISLILNTANADIVLVKNNNSIQSSTSGSSNDAANAIQTIQGINPTDVLQDQPKSESVSLKLSPIKSVLLSAGKIDSRKINLPLTQPIFIIGSDHESLQWLSSHSNQLKTLHAVGLLVNEDNNNDLEQVRKIADGIPIVPVFGDDIAKALQLQHYPALISSNEITQ